MKGVRTDLRVPRLTNSFIKIYRNEISDGVCRNKLSNNCPIIARKKGIILLSNIPVAQRCNRPGTV